LKTKGKLSVSVDQELIDWIDKEIQTKRFASRSHAVDYILTDWIAKEKKKEG
jgi:Arc/MetJ-type ribon-helix-helix transcriptional regulator